MKNYRQFLKELPSKKVVFAFGRFQPPTIGHELLIKAVKKVAAGSDHVIYASRTQDKKKNPLPVARKVYYLKRMFPNTNFVAANNNVRTFIEAVKELNKKYKDIIMIAGSDRVAEYKRVLESYNGKEYNYDSIQVISAGERDPDADGATGMSATKMRESAKKGNFFNFKKGLPHSMTTADARRLMNEIRQGMGLDPIKEELKLNTDKLREQYFQGKIFNVGDIVESNDEQFEILDRGSNYVVVVDQVGETHRKFIQDLNIVEQSVKKDKDSGLPQKYVSGLSPSTAKARAAHWKKANKMSDDDPEAYKPAPGDKTAKTKPSKHTKKFAKMYGEVKTIKVGEDAVMGEGDPHYALVKDRKVIKVGSKEEMINASKDEGGRVWVTKSKVGSIVEETQGTIMEQITYKNFETKHFDQCPVAVDKFNDLIKKDPEDKVALLNAIKSTDEYLGIEKQALKDKKATDDMIDDFEYAQDKAEDYLKKLGDYDNHKEYMETHAKTMNGLSEGWSMKYKRSIDCNNPKGFSQKAHCADKEESMNEQLKFTSADKIKVARIIATTLGVDGASTQGNPVNLVNMGLRNVRKNPMNKAGYQILKKMLDTARMAGIDYDEKLLPTQMKALKAEEVIEENAAVRNKAEKTGLPYGILMQVYKRGVAAWNSGHRPGTTPEQWGLARINSFATGGKTRHTADKDLWKKVKKEGVVQPTGTDDLETNMMNEAKNDTVVVDKSSTYNIAQSVMRYSDLMKMLGKKPIEKFGPAYQEGGFEDIAPEQTETGHSLEPEDDKDDDQLRRRKAQYHLEQIDTSNPDVKLPDDSGRLSTQDSGAYDAFFEEIDEMDEKELDKLAAELENEISDQEVEDETLNDPEVDVAIVDDETGEIIDDDPENSKDEDDEEVNEEVLKEVLSRVQRIRAKMRLRRTKAKRERARKIALKKFSPMKTVQKRARRLAVKALKQRFTRGRDMKKLSVAEKERLEQRIQRMKPILNRIAVKMVPRVRKLEKQRLSHPKVTK